MPSSLFGTSRGEPRRRARGERSSHGGWGAQPHTKERAAARGQDALGGRRKPHLLPRFRGGLLKYLLNDLEQSYSQFSCAREYLKNF